MWVLFKSPSCGWVCVCVCMCVYRCVGGPLLISGLCMCVCVCKCVRVCTCTGVCSSLLSSTLPCKLWWAWPPQTTNYILTRRNCWAPPGLLVPVLHPGNPLLEVCWGVTRLTLFVSLLSGIIVLHCLMSIIWNHVSHILPGFLVVSGGRAFPVSVTVTLPEAEVKHLRHISFW